MGEFVTFDGVTRWPNGAFRTLGACITMSKKYVEANPSKVVTGYRNITWNSTPRWAFFVMDKVDG